MQLDQPHRHHREIRHHVVLFEERAHGAQHLCGVGIARLHHLFEGFFGGIVPVPDILNS